MSLIFLVSSGTCKCFVCDSGTREKKAESTGLVYHVLWFLRCEREVILPHVW
jgi:hypothetical protein